MVRMFPRYSEVKDWQLLDTRIIHAYNTDETPIEIVKVQIGLLDRYDIGLGWSYSAITYPIIRWLTRNEYNRLVAKEDIIVW